MADILTAGGNGTSGKLSILGADDKPILDVQATTPAIAELSLGGDGRSGVVRLETAAGRQSATIDGRNGHLTLGGGSGANGSISLLNSNGINPININAARDSAGIFLGDPGIPGYVQLSGPGLTIEIDAKRNAISFGDPGLPATSTIELAGQQGTARFGGENVNGRVVVQAGDGKPRATLNAADASLRIGGNGANGTVSVRAADGEPLLELLGRPDECVMGLGQKNRPGRISMYGANQQEALRLDAATGDILLANADCAEEFDVEPGSQPGMVMVLTEEGSLTVSQKPYDTRLAGVVSGAGSYRPGMILDRRDTGKARAPIALMGKVYCFADATNLPISVGDLLTTSEYPGHAMSITDRGRALGAVLGKALAPLPSGQALIPVLVTLQ